METMTVAEAADMLHLSRARIHELIAAGRLSPVARHPRLLLLAREDVAAFAAIPRPNGRPRKADA